MLEVGLDDEVARVEVEVGVADAGCADGVGAGVVLEVEQAVRVAPQVDAGEGLAQGPVAVGLDPVMGPVQWPEVADPGGPAPGRPAG